MDKFVKPRILEKPKGEKQVKMYAVVLDRTRMELPHFKSQYERKTGKYEKCIYDRQKVNKNLRNLK
jgi:hypothetical protein